MKFKHFSFYWLPVIIYMAFIFYLSSLSNPIKTLTPKDLYHYLDLPRIIYHIIEYATLSLLLYRALKIKSKYPQSLAIIISAFYGITDEIHQNFVPGRIPSIYDALINIFGAIVMQSIINIYYYVKEKNIK